MRDCKQISELVSQGLDRDLKFGERLELRMHLVICKACRQFDKNMASLRKISQSYRKGKGDGGI